MKKFLALILCLLMTLSVLTACGSTASTATEQPAAEAEAPAAEAEAPAAEEAPAEEAPAEIAHKETLVIGTAEDINNLNLQTQKTANNNIILKTTHQTLVFFNNDPEAETRFDPGLATDWEFEDDTHIIMHLRNDVHFNDEDKTPFTAEDAKFTLDMAVGPDSKIASVLNGYVGCEVVDDYTIKIEIESYNNEFVASLSSVPLSIQSKKAWESGMEEPWYIGTGPYKFESWEEGVCCRVVKVDDYWGKDLPADDFFSASVSDAIEFRPYLEASSRVIALQKTILNRGLWGFYDDMEGFDYDVERAKALMAEAGYPDGGIETTLTYATTGAYANIATVIQANLKEIGINVTLNPMEEATLKETCTNGDQELFLWRWNEDSKVDFVYRDLFYSGEGSNYHHYADAHADELIDKVATEKDQDARRAASTELQEYLVNACPQVPLYIANLVIAYNSNLQGQYFYGGGNHNWCHAYIAE